MSSRVFGREGPSEETDGEGVDFPWGGLWCGGTEEVDIHYDRYTTDLNFMCVVDGGLSSEDQPSKDVR